MQAESPVRLLFEGPLCEVWEFTLIPSMDRSKLYPAHVYVSGSLAIGGLKRILCAFLG